MLTRGLLISGLSMMVLLLGQPAAASNFGHWLTALKQQARAEGISETTINKSLNGVYPNKLVLKLDRNQPEFKLSLAEYLKRVIPKSRIRAGRKKMRENRQLLHNIAGRFKVQPRFLVALWGIETDFGRVTGSLPVVEALITLAYDPRRSDFFRRELLAALHIIDDGRVGNNHLRGSWAGAFGGLQFMPSVFLKYAVDFDNDGTIDPWHDNGDLFASGANYLAKSGWHFNETWGREVHLPPGFDFSLTGLANHKKIPTWQAIGVRQIDGSDLPTRALSSSIIMVDDNRRSFMVYNNFGVLLKWNRSIYYALAVGLLANQLKNGTGK
ncbi:MAG: lytic murein transglycosylase [Deltaproteobacteria bacterium]|nr:lytic murein transglycosylase [Deltaproteobacteria bacterium]